MKPRVAAALLLPALVAGACGGGNEVLQGKLPKESPRVDVGVEALNALAASAGCSPVQTPKIEGNLHITPPETNRYGTSPPTSGMHYPRPSSTGIHREPIQNEVQVHNLEHGHIGIQHRDLAPALVAELERLGRSDPQWIFVAPYPAMSHKVAFTAWGRLLACDGPDARIGDVAAGFVAAFRGKAPESIPGSPLG